MQTSPPPPPALPQLDFPFPSPSPSPSPSPIPSPDPLYPGDACIDKYNAMAKGPICGDSAKSAQCCTALRGLDATCLEGLLRWLETQAEYVKVLAWM